MQVSISIDLEGRGLVAAVMCSWHGHGHVYTEISYKNHIIIVFFETIYFKNFPCLIYMSLSGFFTKQIFHRVHYSVQKKIGK